MVGRYTLSVRQRLCFSSAKRTPAKALTTGQHCDQTLLTQGANHAVEGHRRDVAHHLTPFETEPAVGGNQGLPGYVRTDTAIAQDKVRQDREHRFARGALDRQRVWKLRSCLARHNPQHLHALVLR